VPHAGKLKIAIRSYSAEFEVPWAKAKMIVDELIASHAFSLAWFAECTAASPRRVWPEEYSPSSYRSWLSTRGDVWHVYGQAADGTRVETARHIDGSITFRNADDKHGRKLHYSAAAWRNILLWGNPANEITIESELLRLPRRRHPRHHGGQADD
jgi:hypothetical protein